MSEQPILELKDVHSGYGSIKALKGVSLKVMPGEIVAIIGANGAGKSTTLMTICGIVGVEKRRSLVRWKDDQQGGGGKAAHHGALPGP